MARHPGRESEGGFPWTFHLHFFNTSLKKRSSRGLQHTHLCHKNINQAHCSSIKFSTVCNQIFIVDGLRWRSRENWPLPQFLDFGRPRGAIVRQNSKLQQIKGRGGATRERERQSADLPPILSGLEERWIVRGGQIVSGPILQISPDSNQSAPLTSELVPGQLLRPT